MDEAALARVEAQRTELESNIFKLRKSLRHWQTLEIDYEGLKEEFMALSDDTDIDECLKVGLDFKAEVVDQKELQELLRDGSNRARKPSQLADVLSKRIDYVTKNVETVRKQLSDAERRRNALLLIQDSDHRDDAGLPLAEITEELDEAGNIISSKVENPGKDASQLIDVLKKAGIDNLEEVDGTITASEVSNSSTVTATKTENESVKNAVNEDSGHPLPDGNSANPKDTEEEATLRQEMLDYRNGLDEVGAIVAELDMEEGASDISYDEDSEIIEVDSDYDDDYNEEDLGSEDELGRSTQRLHIPKDYQQRMEELQIKLGLKNLGPQGEEFATRSAQGRPSAAEAARKAALARYEESLKSSLKTAEPSMVPAAPPSLKNSKTKKTVAFSTELNIAPDCLPKGGQSATQIASDNIPRIKPIVETVVERDESLSPRTSRPGESAVPPGAPVKQSRFKSGRHAQPHTGANLPPSSIPSTSPKPSQGHSGEANPPSLIVSTTLVERPASNQTKAPDDDDFDEATHRREVSAEYQRFRMKKILSQEGGFIGEGEADNYGEEVTPVGEDGKKISRFKAARIKR